MKRKMSNGVGMARQLTRAAWRALRSSRARMALRSAHRLRAARCSARAALRITRRVYA